MTKRFFIIALALGLCAPAASSVALKKIKGTYDFFKPVKEFEQETAELTSLYSILYKNFYPLPVVGYLYYYAHQLLNTTFKIPTNDLGLFFSFYTITHNGAIPSSDSYARQAVEKLVTKNILEWLLKSTSNGAQNVSTYLSLVARYILTTDLDLGGSVGKVKKWDDKAYEPLVTPTAKELLACADEALKANRPTDSAALFKGTLFEALKVVLPKKPLLQGIIKPGSKLKKKKKTKSTTILVATPPDSLDPMGTMPIKPLVPVPPVTQTPEEKPTPSTNPVKQLTAQELIMQGYKKLRQEQKEQSKQKASFQPSPPNTTVGEEKPKGAELSSMPPVKPVVKEVPASEIPVITITPPEDVSAIGVKAVLLPGQEDLEKLVGALTALCNFKE